MYSSTSATVTDARNTHISHMCFKKIPIRRTLGRYACTRTKENTHTHTHIINELHFFLTLLLLHSTNIRFYVYSLMSSSLTADGVSTPTSVNIRVIYWGGV